MRFGYVVTAVAAAALLFAGTRAGAQSFPEKPIRIVTAGVGGSVDFVSRLLAPVLSASMGQPVIVDNRPAGTTPGEVVAKSAPDGHTLLVYGSTVWLLPFMRNNVPYDPIRDFAPIAILISSPNVVVVHPSVPAKSVADLIALARAKPGGLNYATNGTGNANHLAGELFKSMARVDIVRINYKAAALAVTDLLSGYVQVMFPNPASVTSHIRAGKLRALATTSAEPSPLLPGLPTVAATVPGYQSAAMSGIWAPAKTPSATINQLNRELLRALSLPEIKQKLFQAGLDAAGSSPQQFDATIKSEMTRLGKVIKDANIRDE